MPIDFNELKVGFLSLTVGHWDLMYDHMNSIYECYPYPKEFFIIPNLDFSLSVAGALNKGFKRARKEVDYIVYIADDAIVRGNDIQNALTTLIEENLWVVVISSCEFAFFAVQPIVFDIVGYWDEGFYPAYFEDNDWHYRIKLTDENKIKFIPGESYHMVSVTLKRMTPERQNQHHRDFERNRDRYIRKWGGLPYHEVYTVPWNGAISE